MALDPRRRFLLAIVAVFLYLILDAVAQSLPPHYDPISQAESDLAVGPYGYIMTINFLNRGVLSLLFLSALNATAQVSGKRGRLRGTLVFAVWGVGAILLAIFPTDVPATPVSWHGAIHIVVAIFAFFGGAFGALMLSLDFGELPSFGAAKTPALVLSALSVILVLVDLGLPFVAHHLSERIGGLTERMFLASVLLWILVVSVALWRRPASLADSPRS